MYCSSGSTFKTFGTIADCCTVDGTCYPATECFAGQIVFYDGGSVSTCFDACSTGFIYKTIGDLSPQSMYGCFDSFDLYRTIDSADAAAALSTTASDASSPSSAGSSAPSSTTSSTATPSSHIHPIIIAVAVVVVVLLLAAIAGLAVWIMMLKRRQRIQSRPTELQPVPSATNDNVGLKAELAAKEISTAELRGPVTETKQPWGTTVSSAEQDQEIWDKPGNQATVMELPAHQTIKNGYQELPG